MRGNGYPTALIVVAGVCAAHSARCVGLRCPDDHEGGVRVAREAHCEGSLTRPMKSTDCVGRSTMKKKNGRSMVISISFGFSTRP
jgi:hypothetical protein